MTYLPGSWHSFQHIEHELTLDELLLLFDVVAQSRHNEFRMQAALQGVELNEDGVANQGDDDLPEELLEAEREWKRKKAEQERSGEKTRSELEGFSLGYQRV